MMQHFPDRECFGSDYVTFQRKQSGFARQELLGTPDHSRRLHVFESSVDSYRGFQLIG